MEPIELIVFGGGRQVAYGTYSALALSFRASETSTSCMNALTMNT